MRGDQGICQAQEVPGDAGHTAATATPERAGEEAIEDGGGRPGAEESRGSISCGGAREGSHYRVGRPFQEEAGPEGKAPVAHPI